ncbi:MAG: ribosome silencing factor [Piscirickettsiaceae bacterium]|nr:ribosome silencing factor [Piscirickettsiaceae bacterium]
MKVEELKLLVIDALEDIKAEDITVLDVKKMTDFTDYMIIATGKSTRQVKALAINVAMQAKAADMPPLGLEGETVGEWALIDLGDVIVHVMTPQMRTTYNLEKLWSVEEKTDQVLAED